MKEDQWDCVLNDLLVVRPMLRVLKFVLKIISQSPEFDRTIFFFEVVLRVEEECLFFLQLGTLDRSELLVQCQSIVFREHV